MEPAGDDASGLLAKIRSRNFFYFDDDDDAVGEVLPKDPAGEEIDNETSETKPMHNEHNTLTTTEKINLKTTENENNNNNSTTTKFMTTTTSTYHLKVQLIPGPLYAQRPHPQMKNFRANECSLVLLEIEKAMVQLSKDKDATLSCDDWSKVFGVT